MACRAMWGLNALDKVPTRLNNHLFELEARLSTILSFVDTAGFDSSLLATVYNVIDILCSRRGRSNGAAQFSEHIMSGLTKSTARRQMVINMLSWMASEVCCLYLCHEQRHVAQHAFCQQNLCVIVLYADQLYLQHICKLLVAHISCTLVPMSWHCLL